MNPIYLIFMATQTALLLLILAELHAQRRKPSRADREALAANIKRALMGDLAGHQEPPHEQERRAQP